MKNCLMLLSVCFVSTAFAMENEAICITRLQGAIRLTKNHEEQECTVECSSGAEEKISYSGCYFSTGLAGTCSMSFTPAEAQEIYNTLKWARVKPVIVLKKAITKTEGNELNEEFSSLSVHSSKNTDH